MKNLLIIVLLFSFCALSIGQETIFYKKTVNVDSVISINGHGLFEYLSTNLRYPIDAVDNSIMGTYIGCIRLDSKGNLIRVFTVNSLCNSIDSNFIDLIKKAWKKKNVVVSNITDTTDIFIQIQYKMSNNESFMGAYDYYVDKDLVPIFISPEIAIVVSFTTTSRTSIIKDEVFIDKANENFTGRTSIIKDEVFIDKANENFKNQKFKECIRPLNELIRRNPYNTDLLVMRGLCYKKLKENELECRDYKYLRFFLESNKYMKLTNCD